MRSLALAAALLLVACSEDPSIPNDFQLVYEAGAVVYVPNDPGNPDGIVICSASMPTVVSGGPGGFTIGPGLTASTCMLDGNSVFCQLVNGPERAERTVSVHDDQEAATVSVAISSSLGPPTGPGAYGCTGTVEAAIVPIE